MTGYDMNYWNWRVLLKISQAIFDHNRKPATGKGRGKQTSYLKLKLQIPNGNLQTLKVNNKNQK